MMKVFVEYLEMVTKYKFYYLVCQLSIVTIMQHNK